MSTTTLVALLAALIGALAPTFAVVASHVLAGRKLEVIRVDVNSNMAAALKRISSLESLLAAHDVAVPAAPTSHPSG